MKSLVAVLGLAACSPGEPAPAVTTRVAEAPGSGATGPQAPAKLSPPTCVAADADLAHASRAPDNTLIACYRSAAEASDPPIDECWSFSIASTSWTPRDRHVFSSETPPGDASFKRTGSVDTATVCAPGHVDCRDLTLPKGLVPAGDPPTISANADRTLVAVVTNRAAVHVLDSAGKPLATLEPWWTPMAGEGNGPSFFRSARFANQALALYIADTPMTAAIRLVDPHTGRKIGDVDHGKPMVDSLVPIELPNHRAGFVELEGNALVIQDTRTGKLLARHPMPGEPDPGMLGAAASADGTAVFFVAGTVVNRIDVASGKVTTFAAPSCQ